MTSSNVYLMGKPLAVIEYDHEDLIVENQNAVREVAYVYEPLPDAHHFRLLELCPGKWGSRLECVISTHVFDEYNVPLYRALSYTWMESKYDRLIISEKSTEESRSLRDRYSIRHPVWCGGRRLLVSTNLRDALRQVRHETLPIRLWIDAICINQEDLDERSRQVLLMSRIYHSAQSIWFWLGASDQESDMALEWIRKICQAKHLLEVKGNQLPSRSMLLDDTEIVSIGLYPLRFPEWKALVDFFNRPVFRRIWIVQEIVTARKVIAYCGSSELDLSYIANAIDFITQCSWDSLLSNYYNAGQNSFAYVHAIWSIREEWLLHGANLRRRVVQATRNFQATDPKDKVYSLLGLLNDFAHRRACDLGLCPESHQTSTQFQDKWPNMTISSNSSKITGLQIVASVVGELIRSQLKAESQKEDQAALLILRDKENEQASAIYQNLITYVMLSTFHTEVEFKKVTGDDLKHEEIIKVKLSFAETGNNGYIPILNNAFTAITNELKAIDEENHEMGMVKAFVTKTVNPTMETFGRMKHLQGFADVQGEYIKQLQDFHAQLSLILRQLLDPNFYEAKLPNLDDKGEEQNAHCSSSQSGVFCSTASSEPIGNMLLLACDTSEATTLRSILNALCCQNADPKQLFPDVSMGLPKLIMAFFGDLSEWDETQPGLWVKKSPYNPEMPELVELNKWLGLEKTSQHDHDSSCSHKTSKKQRREAVNHNPIQHWSWSSNISRLPDYHLSESEIYREFTLRCLNDDGDLFILSMAGYSPERRLSDLPSWVPDLGISNGLNCLAFPTYDVAISYISATEPVSEAAGDKVEFGWSAKEPDILRIQAHEIDQISTISSIESPKKFSWSTAFNGWESLIAKLPKTYHSTKEPKLRALWRTIVGNCTHAPQYTYPAPQTYSSHFEAFKLVSRLETQLANSAAGDEEARERILKKAGLNKEQWWAQIEDSRLFSEAIERVMRNRRFFITQKGYLGVAPKSAKVGDLVCVLRGGRTPFVIRYSAAPSGVRNGRTEGAYTFVGECYAHGFMRGEALRDKGFRWEEVRLV